MDRLNLIQMLTIVMLFITMFACSSPEKDWQVARHENTIEAYQNFLRKFPSSEFTEEASKRLEKLEWESAIASNELTEYRAFLDKYTDSQHREEARKRIDDIEWEKSIATNTIKAYQTYLSSVPLGSHKNAAEVAIDCLFWEEAKQSNTAEAYQEFLETNPSSAFTEQARAALRLLYTVTEAAELIFDKRVQARGSMTFTTTGNVCNRLKYDGEFEAIGRVKIPQAWRDRQASGFVTCFVPGVQHKYVGRICLPARWESATVSEHVDGTGKTEGGLWYFDGPISVNGEFSYNPKQGARFFEITSMGSSGLVLELTRNGYTHISGRGRIVTPKGQEFVF